MKRKKYYKNIAEKFNWINQLIKEDYKFMIMPKGKQKVFYATKETKQKKNGDFYSSAKFDEYRLEKDEEWIPGKDMKGVFIKI